MSGAGPLIPKHALLHDFLSDDLHDRMLRYAVERAPEFTRATIYDDAVEIRDPARRVSEKHPQGLGPFKAAFVQQVRARLDAIFAGAGMTPRSVTRYETELVMHGDGGHFRRHVDTLTARADDGAASAVRAVSCVYYFFRQPKGFAGGALRLFGFGSDESVAIEPEDNALLVFPSFASHEVGPVSCATGAFADFRYSVNCWLHCALGAQTS